MEKLCKKGTGKALGFQGCLQRKERHKYGLCKDCFSKWISNTESGQEFLRSSKIKPISEKRKQDNKEYKKLREKYLKENPKCEITGLKATEIHHKYSGKDRDKYYLDTSTWMAVSRKAHNYIHKSPKEAREKGWLK